MPKQYDDEPNDTDQNNPVDCSSDTWTELFDKDPDLLDRDL